MNPPAQYVNELGRMNDVGESKFYACIGGSSKLGSLDEIRVENGTRVTQLFFRVKKKIDLIVGIGHSKHWQTNKPINELSNLSLGKQELKKQISLTRWLHSVFLKTIDISQRSKYKKTIAISRVYERLFSTQGIIFPSVTSQGSCTNIVMEPNVALSCLKPLKVRVLVAHKATTKKGYAFHYVKESTNIDLSTGSIKWKSQSLFNQEAEQSFLLADKSKIISLGGGRYAYPHPTEADKVCIYSQMEIN